MNEFSRKRISKRSNRGTDPTKSGPTAIPTEDFCRGIVLNTPFRVKGANGYRTCSIEGELKRSPALREAVEVLFLPGVVDHLFGAAQLPGSRRTRILQAIGQRIAWLDSAADQETSSHKPEMRGPIKKRCASVRELIGRVLKTMPIVDKLESLRAEEIAKFAADEAKAVGEEFVERCKQFGEARLGKILIYNALALCTNTMRAVDEEKLPGLRPLLDHFVFAEKIRQLADETPNALKQNPDRPPTRINDRIDWYIGKFEAVAKLSRAQHRDRFLRDLTNLLSVLELPCQCEDVARVGREMLSAAGIVITEKTLMNRMGQKTLKDQIQIARNSHPIFSD